MQAVFIVLVALTLVPSDGIDFLGRTQLLSAVICEHFNTSNIYDIDDRIN